MNGAAAAPAAVVRKDRRLDRLVVIRLEAKKQEKNNVAKPNFIRQKPSACPLNFGLPAKSADLRFDPTTL
jgi:hypothetical protein